MAPSRVSARRSLIDVAPTQIDVMRVPGPAEGAPATDFEIRVTGARR